MPNTLPTVGTASVPVVDGSDGWCALEIYSYLRSPYRDLNTYDQTAQVCVCAFLCRWWVNTPVIQYDTPPEISLPREIERGRRWSAEPSPSRRSRSPDQSPVPRRENGALRSPNARHRRDVSAEARQNSRLANPSPRGREDHGSRNHPSDRRHSPSDGVQGILRNEHSGRVSFLAASQTIVRVENQDNDFPVQLQLGELRGDEKGKGLAKEDMEDIVAATDTPKLGAPRGDESTTSLAACEVDVTRLTDTPPQVTSDEVADYVDDVGASGGSAANPLPSRKRSAGLSVHPRNRTLSASVQAYLSRPAARRHPPTKPPTVSGDEQPTQTSDAGTRLRRFPDGPTGPTLGESPRLFSSRCETTAERTADGEVSLLDDDAAFAQHGHPIESSGFSSGRALCVGVQHAGGVVRRSDTAAEGATRTGEDAFASGRPGLEVSRVKQRSGLAERSPSVNDARSGGRASLDDRVGVHDDGGTSVDASVFHGDERAGCEDELVVTVGDDAPPPVDFVLVSGPGSGSNTNTSIETKTKTMSMTDVSALETRLRARARLRVRLAAIKGVVGSVSSSDASSGASAGAGLSGGQGNETG